MFGVPVSACVATPEMAGAPLTTEEFRRVARANPERQAEYAAGRAAARQALNALGVGSGSLPSAPDRTPIWPDAIVGSISHCTGLCAAVVAKLTDTAGIGFDAEPAEVLAPGLANYVCRPDDAPLRWSPSLRDTLPWAKLVFSAKEAVFKCQYPRYGHQLDFQELGVIFHPEEEEDRGSFRIQLASAHPLQRDAWRFTGAWKAVGQLLLTAVWVGP